MLVSPPLCLPSIFRFPRLKKTRPTHTLLGPLGSPNKWKGHWLGDGEPRGFSKCISAQCPLFGRAALGNINFAISAGQVHYHYLNCPWGGTWIILAGCIKLLQKNPQFTRLDQQGKGNLQQGEESGPKHLVGRVISRTEGELTFQHNQRSEEYYLRSASKKATKLKATDRTRRTGVCPSGDL